MSAKNEAAALELLERAAESGLQWTSLGGGEALSEGAKTMLAALQASDKRLLEASIRQAQVLRAQPVRDVGGGAGQGAVADGFDDVEAW